MSPGTLSGMLRSGDCLPCSWLPAWLLRSGQPSVLLLQSSLKGSICRARNLLPHISALLPALVRLSCIYKPQHGSAVGVRLASSPHPVQAIGRIYRMGQQHPTFVYRLLYSGTAEHVMHNQSVDKQGLFMRVVDEKYIRGDSCGVLLSCRQLSMPAGQGCQPDHSCLQSSACPWLCLHFHMC